MSTLCITGLFELVVLWFGEGDAEHADNVSIGGTAVNGCLDNGLTLLDERTKLVTGHVHSMEVEETVESLNILDTKLNLTVGCCFVVIEIGKGKFNHTSLKSLRGNLGTLGLGDDGLSTFLHLEDGRSNELVPFFL